MVVYKLRCETGHEFEGWFAGHEAFDRQAASGLVSCPSCATGAVRRLPSAPYVHTSGTAPSRPAAPPEDVEKRRRLQELKAYILANTEDVGRQFPERARRIHYGEEEGRSIRGQVTVQEAGELLEEGIPAIPIGTDLVVDKVH